MLLCHRLLFAVCLTFFFFFCLWRLSTIFCTEARRRYYDNHLVVEGTVHFLSRHLQAWHGPSIGSKGLCHRLNTTGSTLIRISLFIEFVRFVNPIGNCNASRRYVRVSLTRYSRFACLCSFLFSFHFSLSLCRPSLVHSFFYLRVNVSVCSKTAVKLLAIRAWSWWMWPLSTASDPLPYTKGD